MARSTSGAPTIDVRGLVKRFGRTEVLRGLDLQVLPGEVHAFLGPNGAGKTTTIRILLGLLRSDGGSMSVLGMDPWRDVATLHQRLAYVPGDVSLWPNLSGGEVIDLLARLRGGVDVARRDALVEQFQLDPTKKGRTYSKGNRQKVALISALASDVDVYLLDEPTSGLDPLMDAEFRTCIADLRAGGKSVLLSSHILSEAEALSDRVSIIRAGIVVETGSLSEMRHLTRTAVTARVSDPGLVRAAEGVHDLTIEEGVLTAQVEGAAMAPFVASLAEAGVTSLVSEPPSLEQLFLRHYADGSS